MDREGGVGGRGGGIPKLGRSLGVTGLQTRPIPPPPSLSPWSRNISNYDHRLPCHKINETTRENDLSLDCTRDISNEVISPPAEASVLGLRTGIQALPQSICGEKEIRWVGSLLTCFTCCVLGWFVSNPSRGDFFLGSDLGPSSSSSTYWLCVFGQSGISSLFPHLVKKEKRKRMIL